MWLEYSEPGGLVDVVREERGAKAGTTAEAGEQGAEAGGSSAASF